MRLITSASSNLQITGRHVRRGMLVFSVMLPMGFMEVATASAPTFCVRPINVVVPDISGINHLVNPQESLPKAPDYVEQSSGARYPLAWHHHNIDRPDGLKTNRSLFWSFSSQYELIGPRDFFGAFGPVTVDGSGRSFLLGGSYDKTESGKLLYRQYLLQQANEGIIVEADSNLQKDIGEPRHLSWSHLLEGLIISSVKWRKDRTAGDEATFLLKGNSMTPLSSIDFGVDVVADLPGLGVVGLLGSRSFTIINPNLETTKVAYLNPGDDYGGFNALYETRDEGWLYVAGGQYDNAVHVEQVNGKWRATKIVRISDATDSPFEAFLQWLIGIPRGQIRRDGLSKIIRAGKCRRYSSAIKRMFYCGDSHSWEDVHYELRSGEMVPIAVGAVNLRSFLGDADSLGLALFLGTDHALYGYDGERVHRIANVDFEDAHVQDLPNLRRTFLSTQKALFELRAKGDGFDLVKLASNQISELFAGPILAAPDGKAVLLFTRRGIYLVKSDALPLIWSPEQTASVNEYGGTPPTYVAGWDGILFTTGIRDDTNFFLLKSCPDSKPNDR